MKKYLSALIILGVSMTVAATQSLAQTPSAAPNTKKAVKKSVKKTPAKKTLPANKELPATDEDDSEPDIASSSTTEFNCELGNKLTVYENAGDNKHIGLRWNKKLHRLSRVDTTTGANRFENRKYGLVWIGIPAKGMLLDSKKGQQLANECKSPEQLMPKPPKALEASATPATPMPPIAQEKSTN